MCVLLLPWQGHAYLVPSIILLLLIIQLLLLNLLKSLSVLLFSMFFCLFVLEFSKKSLSHTTFCKEKNQSHYCFNISKNNMIQLWYIMCIGLVFILFFLEYQICVMLPVNTKVSGTWVFSHTNLQMQKNRWSLSLIARLESTCSKAQICSLGENSPFVAGVDLGYV